MAAPLYARYIPPGPSQPPKTATLESPAVESPALAQKKAKRKQQDDTARKRKKAKHEHAEKPQEPEEGDDVAKRHRRVLSKYQKSSQIAEVVRDSSKPTVTEEDQEPAPELHGMPQPCNWRLIL